MAISDNWGKAHINNTISFGGGVSCGDSFDPDYQAVLDYATTQGYTLPSAGQQTLQDQLVVDLKAAGVWSKLDSFRVYATDGDANFALVDWVRLITCSAVNSPTFTTNVGYKGNGTSARIDSLYNPSIDAVNLSLNSASFFNYKSELRTTGQVQAYEGYFQTGVTAFMIAGGGLSGENYINSLNSLANNSTAQNIGFHLTTRVAASDLRTYYNGSLQVSSSAASSSLPTGNIWDFSANNLAAGTFFSDTGSAIKGYGADLSAEQADFNTAIQNYITAL